VCASLSSDSRHSSERPLNKSVPSEVAKHGDSLGKVDAVSVQVDLSLLGIPPGVP
jgi:hypothetical protein